jgi:hypothetical protein
MDEKWERKEKKYGEIRREIKSEIKWSSLRCGNYENYRIKCHHDMLNGEILGRSSEHLGSYLKPNKTHAI